MGHGGGTSKKPPLGKWLLPPAPAAHGPRRASARREAAVPGGRAGLLQRGRASPSQAPAVPACSAALPRYSPLGNGSIFLLESALSPRKRSPGEEGEDDGETQPRLFLSPPRLFLSPPQAPRTGAASGSPEPLRPRTPQPEPTDPAPPLPRSGTQPAQPGDTTGSARGSVRSSGAAGANPPQLSPARVPAPALPSPCGSRCSAYSSQSGAAQRASRPGGPGQPLAGRRRPACVTPDLGRASE